MTSSSATKRSTGTSSGSRSPIGAAPPVESFDLKLELQGCADRGLCYFPQNWTATVALPPAPFLGLGAIDTSATGDLLPVDDAFTMNARFDKPNELTVAWQIAPDYYLYRDKLTFAVNGRISLGAPTLPAGEPHTDDNFGDVEVFRDYVEIKVPFARASPDALDVEITAGFQGCKDDSICYPPGEQFMSLVLPATSEFPASAAPASGEGDELVSEQDQWLAASSTARGGRCSAASTSPGCCCRSRRACCRWCRSSRASSRAKEARSRRSAASCSRCRTCSAWRPRIPRPAPSPRSRATKFRRCSRNPGSSRCSPACSSCLALGMFGLFELQMPAAIQTRLANMANRQKAGTFIGTAIIGALTALIVTTCVAPPLIGALTFISQTGDVARGSGALFALSMGMGTPLLLVGASAGQLLPRVGPWMNTVKAGFGVMLIGVAIWMMDRVLPGSVTLVLWALLVFLTGVFLGAFEPLPAAPTPAAPSRERPRRARLPLWRAAADRGDARRRRPAAPDPTRRRRSRLGGRRPARVTSPKTRSTSAPIETVAELDAALREARTAGQPVMLDFTAEWCVSCKEMEEYTFSEAARDRRAETVHAVARRRNGQQRR